MIHLQKRLISKSKDIGTIDPKALVSPVTFRHPIITIDFSRTDEHPAGAFSLVGTEDEIEALAQELLRLAAYHRTKRNEWTAYYLRKQQEAEAAAPPTEAWLDEDPRRREILHESTMYCP